MNLIGCSYNLIRFPIFSWTFLTLSHPILPAEVSKGTVSFSHFVSIFTFLN